MNDKQSENSWPDGHVKLAIIQLFIRHGPWAVLATGLLAAGIWQVDKHMTRYVTAQELYIKQSRQNVTSLSNAITLLTRTAVSNTERIGSVHQMLVTAQVDISSTLKIMQETQIRMYDRDAELLKILQRLQSGIDDLLSVERAQSTDKIKKENDRLQP